MAKKAIFVARIAKFFTDFELNDIQLLLDSGYEVWCAGSFAEDAHKLNDYPVHQVDIPFVRSPLAKQNLAACKQLTELLKEEKFDLMHCHMPVGGVYARLAAHKAGVGRVIYTAHGLQFCQGGPKKDWLLFYPVEKFLSRWTDTIITMNHEDYDLVQKKFHNKRTEYIPGIGVDTAKFAAAENKRTELCRDLNVSEDAMLFLSVGELSVRKNHEAAIRGLAEAIQKQKNSEGTQKEMHLLIVGIGIGAGNLEDYLKDLCKQLGVAEYVHFLGWRNDIAELNKSCDAFVFPSKREGLPVALLEAMAAGKPLISAIARGNTDLVEDGVNGYLVDAIDPSGYADAMIKMTELKADQNPNSLWHKMSEENLRRIKEYDRSVVKKRMKEIYEI